MVGVHRSDPGCSAGILPAPGFHVLPHSRAIGIDELEDRIEIADSGVRLEWAAGDWMLELPHPGSIHGLTGVGRRLFFEARMPVI